MRRKEYTKLEAVSVEIGDSFEYKLETVTDKISQIRVLLPRSEAKSSCGFFKSAHRPVPGGHSLPWWMEYDDHDNILRSKDKVPNLKEDRRQFIVQIEDEAGIIQEKFTINITAPEETNDLREIKEDKNMNPSSQPSLTAEVELTDLGTIVKSEESKLLSTDGTSQKLNSLSAPLPRGHRQGSSIPRPSGGPNTITLPADSPLRAAKSKAQTHTSANNEENVEYRRCC